MLGTVPFVASNADVLHTDESNKFDSVVLFKVTIMEREVLVVDSNDGGLDFQCTDEPDRFDLLAVAEIPGTVALTCV